MKCPACGKIVRKDHGQLVTHPCATDTRRIRRGPRRGERVADRETQHGRYIDAGPQNWDDE